MKIDKKIIILFISGGVGALLGYSYYYFIGCNSGSCPLTSNWYVTTLYGLVAGLVVGFPSKKKNNGDN